MGMSRAEFMAMIQKKKDAAKGKGGKEAADQKEDAKKDKPGAKESKADKKEDTADRLKKLPFARVKMKK